MDEEFGTIKFHVSKNTNLRDNGFDVNIFTCTYRCSELDNAENISIHIDVDDDVQRPVIIPIKAWRDITIEHDGLSMLSNYNINLDLIYGRFRTIYECISNVNDIYFICLDYNRRGRDIFNRYNTIRDKKILTVYDIERIRITKNNRVFSKIYSTFPFIKNSNNKIAIIDSCFEYYQNNNVNILNAINELSIFNNIRSDKIIITINYHDRIIKLVDVVCDNLIFKNLHEYVNTKIIFINCKIRTIDFNCKKIKYKKNNNGIVENRHLYKIFHGLKKLYCNFFDKRSIISTNRFDNSNKLSNLNYRMFLNKSRCTITPILTIAYNEGNIVNGEIILDTKIDYDKVKFINGNIRVRKNTSFIVVDLNFDTLLNKNYNNIIFNTRNCNYNSVIDLECKYVGIQNELCTPKENSEYERSVSYDSVPNSNDKYICGSFNYHNSSVNKKFINNSVILNNIKTLFHCKNDDDLTYRMIDKESVAKLNTYNISVDRIYLNIELEINKLNSTYDTLVFDNLLYKSIQIVNCTINNLVISENSYVDLLKLENCIIGKISYDTSKTDRIIFIDNYVSQYEDRNNDKLKYIDRYRFLYFSKSTMDNLTHNRFIPTIDINDLIFSGFNMIINNYVFNNTVNCEIFNSINNDYNKFVVFKDCFIDSIDIGNNKVLLTDCIINNEIRN